MKKLDLLGQKFGRLLVIDFEPFVKNKDSHWKCQCDCGKIIVTKGTNLTHGVTKSCGCLRRDTLRKTRNDTRDQRIKTLRLTLKNRRKPESEVAYNILKGTCKRLHRNFSLTYDEFLYLIGKDCFYCGSDTKSLVYKSKNGREFYRMGIDRVDSSKGYIMENCVPCCKICNAAKMDMSIEEFYLWIEKVYRKKYNE